MTTKNKRLTDELDFNMDLGWFYHAWTVTEALLDYAICKFLRLSHAEAHILTAGMEHGRKSILLRSLISRSDHPNRDKLIQALNAIQNESLRNVFAHSYIASDDKVITFVERSRGGSYRAKEHNFSKEAFANHVRKFGEASQKFEEALELEPLELEAFQHAALSVNSNS